VRKEPTDDNAATAPGKLCGAVIKAGQEARRRVSGEWIHGVPDQVVPQALD
jgi:hypothetical protein